MYKSIYYDRPNNTVHLWTDGKHNDKEYETFKYQPYAYIVDKDGDFKTLTGLKVKKVKKWTKEAEEQGMVFEHDVPILSRILIDRYYETDEPSVDNRILFFDIEIEKGLRYSTPWEALNRITSIAFYFNGKYGCLLLDETGKVEDQIRQVNVTGTDKKVEVQIKVFKTESDLLLAFLSIWNKIKPEIIVGWNSTNFDIPYVYNRMSNVIGKHLADKLSPIEIVGIREFGKDKYLKIAGVVDMDYLQLYKKFTYNEESSYSLESISQKELKRGKYKYDGTLDQLFESNIDGFIEYNVNDVELIVSIDNKMDLIEIARGICHAGHVPYDDYQMSSRYLEGASLVYCKRHDLVAIRSNIGDTNHGQAEGALVKNPKPGIYEYVIDLDLTSLYPSLIRTLNISPETIYGKVQNWIETEYNTNLDKIYILDEFTTIQDKLMGVEDKRFEFTKDELWTFIRDNNLSIASNGVLFKKDKEGLIPAILTQWFNERKRLSKLAEEYGNAGDEVKYKFYDQRQLIQKILLNSFYGVLLLPSFRFYNKNAGEAITITGQNVILFSMKIANHFCNAKMGTNDVDYVAAGDTDSVAGDSIVHFSDGSSKTIADLFNSYISKSFIKDCNNREFVFPTDCILPYYDENEKVIKFGKVDFIERHKIKKRRFKITTKSGKSIVVTEDHSIMILSDESGQLVQRKPMDLMVDDKLITY